MFDPDIDTFGDDAVSDTFVDNDSDGMRSDVKDSSGPSMVVLVWHALLKRTIAFDVDQVTPFVHSQVSGQMLHSPATEVP